jgi:hypothetical protein
MKITKRQLKRIIVEALLEYDDDDWAEEENLADDADYSDGITDAEEGLPIRKDASPTYLEGWADGGGL